MKKTLIALSILSGTVIIPTSFAADGTINFTGNITDQACTVETSSATQNVYLGDVGVKAFSAAGDTAAAKPFTIDLKDCPASVTKVRVKFDGSRDSQNSNLLKLSPTSTATGVGIAIYESDSNTLVPMLQESSQQTIDSSLLTNTLHFVAKYMSTANPVTAGSANGTTDFTIMYN